MTDAIAHLIDEAIDFHHIPGIAAYYLARAVELSEVA